jgi:hypothetical protein
MPRFQPHPPTRKTSIARLAKFYKANVPENGVGVLCNETPFFQERLALISAS